MYQGPAFVDPTAHVMFHELIHELFTLTKQTDVLHADLIAGQGYVADAAVDLLACYNGNQLNTPQAIANLEQEKANL
jgi:folate-dependent tRNA-U54 methylase TrmFO/GidA